MPTYEYRCPRCSHQFEVFHGMRDESPRRCPKCRARAQRVPSGGAGLLFKGSGFYITDYRSKGYKEKARQERSGSGGSAGAPPAGPGAAPRADKAGGKTPSGA